MHKRGDRVVAAGGLAQGAAGGVGGACVQGPVWQAAHGTSSQGPAQPRRRRRETDHPGVIDLRVAEFSELRVGAP